MYLSAPASEPTPSHQEETCGRCSNPLSREGPNKEEMVLKENDRNDSDSQEKPGTTKPVDTTSADWPDPFAIGKAKLENFWPTYVKEADQHDNELSEGWNKMLDLILIFAALFSAISTAFVLESSKDLKPDPTESAAATLLIISQTLLTISNRSALPSLTATTGPPPFIPATSAIAVNVLWFSSLILSVSVTLVAMLAKEWAYLFVASRTGGAQEQARKRQERFDSMEAWKLAGLITALPTLMHIALFLFAVGLCVYLWTIHLVVAVPVVILTSLTALIYVAALILPLIYDLCPYATALSQLIKPYSGTRFGYAGRLSADPASDGEVVMDDTLSRALAWLITTSESPASVDLALQAIAGTNHTMPNAALLACGVHWSLLSRLSQFKSTFNLQVEKVDKLEASGSSAFATNIVYAQVLNLLAVHRQERFSSRFNASNPPGNSVFMLEMLNDLYSRLCSHVSPPISTVGYSARAICKQYLNGDSFDGSSHVLDASALAIGLLKQQDSPTSRLGLSTFSNALYAEATHWDYSSPRLSVQKPQILKNVLVIAPLAQNTKADSDEYVRALSTVGLAMNQHASTPLGDIARQYFSARIQETLSAKHTISLAPLGLAALLRALQLEDLLESIEVSQLEPILDILHLCCAAAQSGFVSDALSGINFTKHVVDAVFDYHQYFTSRDIHISVIDGILGSILQQEREPYLTSIVAALFEQPASNELRLSCVCFIAQNEQEAVGASIGLLCNAFYEAARLGVPHGRSLTPVDSEDVLRLTRHFNLVSVNDRQDVRVAIHSLLQKLLQNHLFGPLVVCIVQASSEGLPKDWRGINAGLTVRFWGEYVIQWSRLVLSRREEEGIAEMLRRFFASEEELQSASGVMIEDAANLKALLWREISQSEEPPAVSITWVGRWVCRLLHDQSVGHGTTIAPRESA